MAGKSKNNDTPQNTERCQIRFWPAVALIVIAAAICLFLWWTWIYKSVDKRLAAIDAARTIPEAENAATIYNQLLEEYDKSIFAPALLTPALDGLTRNQPWFSKDHPELAKWLEEQQDIVERLLQVSNLEKCFFPICTPLPEGLTARNERLIIMRQWARFLARSANNDIAEGRIDQSLRKCFCLIRMGKHNRQQPVAIDFVVGFAIEALGLQRIRFLAMHEDVTEEHLKVIETALSRADADWNRQWEIMLEVEKLYGRKMPKSGSLPKRLKDWWENRGNWEAGFRRIDELYSRLLADRCGSRIVIELRRFKNRTGHWPESLDEIRPLAAEGILIDPQNEGPFVYKLDGDGFILYSKGPDNIDQNGKSRGGADDRPIWPLEIKTIPAVEQ